MSDNGESERSAFYSFWADVFFKSIFWGAGMWFILWRHDEMPLWIMIGGAAAFGLTTTYLERRLAKRKKNSEDS